MARPAWSYAEGRGQGDPDSSSDSSSSSSSSSSSPQNAGTGLKGTLLTEGGSGPITEASGSSTTDRKFPFAGPSMGNNYTLTADSYLRWLNSRYTPNIARATNKERAEAEFFNDPASNEFVIAAARQFYINQSGFRPSWAKNFLIDNIIPAAQELGISPYTLLQQIRTQGVTKDSGAIPTGGSRGSGGGGGGGGGSSTQQSIDLSSPTQARGLLMQTMQGVLGRDPNSEEYENFLKILNEAQSGSPQIATASGSTVTRSGGVDAGVVALDYAQSRDDYEDVQNKQYYDMFLNVLAGG